MTKSPQTARHLFSSLKSDQLSKLFALCGIGGASAATKSVKSSILTRALPKSQYFPTLGTGLENGTPAPTTQHARLLSIDMGLKNLAYCVLDVELPSLNSPEMIKEQVPKTLIDAISSSNHGHAILPNALEHVTLINWKRIDVLAEAAKLHPPPNFINDDTESIDLADDPETVGEKPSTSKPKKVPSHTFEPLTLSRVALNLVQNEFLQYNPTHVVIERQRHRTGGHSSVQEWTVRVNTFEACLWAVLTTLQQQHQLRATQMLSTDKLENGASTQMHLASVLPKQVAKFWLDDHHPTLLRTSSTHTKTKDTAPTDSSSLENTNTVVNGNTVPTEELPSSTNPKPKGKTSSDKSAKINVAYTWLTSTFLKLSPAVSPMVTDFVYTIQQKSNNLKQSLPRPSSNLMKRAEEPAKRKLAKIDDLADCLLQGVATVQWDLNRRVILSALEKSELCVEFTSGSKGSTTAKGEVVEGIGTKG